MNKSIFTLLIMVFFSILVFNVSAQGSRETLSSSTSAVSGGGGADSDSDGIPNNAEQLLGTNPYLADTDGDSVPDADDEFPLTSSISLEENSKTPLSVKVQDARVEDNFKASDHLEITLKNTGSSDIIFQDCMINITDKMSGNNESYYVDMKAYTLKGGSKDTIHFDNGKDAGHFPGNINGLYRTAADGLIFDVSLHSKGFAPLQVQAEKAPGTAEVAD